MKYTNLDYLNDYILVSSHCSLTKTAGEGFFDDIKDQIINAVPKDGKSLTNFLAPAVIYQLITSLTGAKWFGAVVGILVTTFKIDVASILGKMCDQIKDLISSGVSLTKDKIADIVDSNLPQMSKTSSLDKLAFNFSKEKETALGEFAEKLLSGNSRSGIFTKVISLFGSFLRFFFITSLTAMGFLAAGSVIRSIIPTSKNENQSQSTSPTSTSSPTQKEDNSEKWSDKVFNRPKEWVIERTNNKTNIENFVLDSVQKYYPSLKDEELIKSPAFKAIVKQIQNHNYSTSGWRMFVIPSNWKSEKDIANAVKNDL